MYCLIISVGKIAVLGLPAGYVLDGVLNCRFISVLRVRLVAVPPSLHSFSESSSGSVSHLELVTSQD